MSGPTSKSLTLPNAGRDHIQGPIDAPIALVEYAGSLGLDAGRLLGEVLNGAHSARVREDFRSGARGGVNGTPTFFINGVRYAGAFDSNTLIAALLNSD